MNNTFDEIIHSNETLQEKARRISDKIRDVRRYSWVGVYEVRDRDIRIISCAGRPEPAFVSFPKDKGLNGRAVTSGETVRVNNIDKDEDYLLTFTSTKSEIVVPIFNGEKKIVGTIDVESAKENAFSDEDVQFLEECAEQIASLWQA